MFEIFGSSGGPSQPQKTKKRKLWFGQGGCWISVGSGGVSGWVGVYGGVQGGTDWSCARASKFHRDFEMEFPFLMHRS